MNWKNYQYIYDLYINGKRIQRIWGRKKAMRIAKQQSGCLFEVNHVELYNIVTGELEYERG